MSVKRSIQPVEVEPNPLAPGRMVDAGLQDALLGMLESAGAGLAVATPRTFENANAAFLSLAAMNSDELARASPRDVLGIDIATLPPSAGIAAHLTTSDGRAIPIDLQVAPLDGGASDRVLLLVYDGRERRSSADELETARRQVAQSEKLSVLGSLVSGLAHEIRTPLAYLDNHVSLMESRLGRALRHDPVPSSLLADLPGHLASAHEGVDRINRLVKDLRRFIKMEVGARRSLPLDEIVRDALRLFEAAHRGRAAIEVDLRPTVAAVVDSTQIQQVVINLLDNAADATHGRAPVRVSTRTGVDGRAEVAVSDSGIGIPPEVLERMYDPFFSTKNDGTGLGLAIVRRIVESHQGTIDCHTVVGGGTTFRVTLPPASGENAG